MATQKVATITARRQAMADVLAVARWSGDTAALAYAQAEHDATYQGEGCYSDHGEDIRTKGACDYCGGVR